MDTFNGAVCHPESPTPMPRARSVRFTSARFYLFGPSAKKKKGKMVLYAFKRA